jgi:hypothetical protein
MASSGRRYLLVKQRRFLLDLCHDDTELLNCEITMNNKEIMIRLYSQFWGTQQEQKRVRSWRRGQGSK